MVFVRFVFVRCETGGRGEALEGDPGDVGPRWEMGARAVGMVVGVGYPADGKRRQKAKKDHFHRALPLFFDVRDTESRYMPEEPGGDRLVSDRFRNALHASIYAQKQAQKACSGGCGEGRIEARAGTCTHGTHRNASKSQNGIGRHTPNTHADKKSTEQMSIHTRT